MHKNNSLPFLNRSLCILFLILSCTQKPSTSQNVTNKLPEKTTESSNVKGYIGPGFWIKDSVYVLTRERAIYPDKDKTIDPKFPGGKKSMEKFINNHRNQTIRIPDSLREGNDNFYNVHVFCRIDQNGKIVENSVELWAGYKYCIEDINNIITQMPNWEPAYTINRKNGSKYKAEGTCIFTIKYFYNSGH